MNEFLVMDSFNLAFFRLPFCRGMEFIKIIANYIIKNAYNGSITADFRCNCEMRIVKSAFIRGLDAHEVDSVVTEHEPSATRRHGQPELRLIDLTPGGNKESHN